MKEKSYQTYYFELNGFGHGERNFANDQEAKAYLLEKQQYDLVCIYKESDSPDGLPFIMVWEKGE